MPATRGAAGSSTNDKTQPNHEKEHYTRTPNMPHENGSTATQVLRTSTRERTPYHGETDEYHDRSLPEHEKAQHRHGHQRQDEVHDQLLVNDQELLREDEDPRETERFGVKR